MSTIRPRFSPRMLLDDPEIAGMCACDGDVVPLLDRLLQDDDDALGRLRMVASRRVAIVLGPAADLPWRDGVIYLRRVETLLLPTWSRADVPLGRLAAAVLRANPELRPPVVLLPDRRWLVSAAGARPIERAALARRREAWA